MSQPSPSKCATSQTCTPACCLPPTSPTFSLPQEQDIQLQQLQMQHQHHPQHQRSSSFAGTSPTLTLPHAISHAVPGPMKGPASLQQHHQHLQQRQSRVDEWLGRRQETWQEWQERIPLEHMHSGSSSTLTVSLDQA